MNGPSDLIATLETLVANSNIARRADVLCEVTDLFVAGSSFFSKDQVDFFEDVMGRIIGQVTVAARSKIAAELAGVANAPTGVLRTLALDEAIEVAGPMLEHSERLDDNILLESGSANGQQHLMAISKRNTLSSKVTDFLVERGNSEVVLSTASNLGAEFSDVGYSALVSRSQDNLELAMRVWLRPEVPRRYLLQLLSEASAAVSDSLEGLDRKRVKLLRNMTVRAADLLQSETRQRSENFRIASARVEALHANGAVDEEVLADFARKDEFDETIVALSLLSRLPIGVIERSLMDPLGQHLLIVCKAAGLKWETTESLFGLRGTISAQQLQQMHCNFMKLQTKTAKMAIEFYRLRENAASVAVS